MRQNIFNLPSLFGLHAFRAFKMSSLVHLLINYFIIYSFIFVFIPGFSLLVK